MRNHKPKSSAFTLVELLVVIGIIGLLISMLLPSLNKAREASRTLACLANLRSIGQAMQMYASENKGAIVGSPWTTARHLWTGNGSSAGVVSGLSTSNVPGDATEYFDFIGPLARVMGISGIPNTNDGRLRAMSYYERVPQFKCPSNISAIATYYPTGSPPAGMKSVTSSSSYATAASFLVMPNPNGLTVASGYGGTLVVTNGYWQLPSHYGPKITKVGRSSEKIYMYDSGKWSRPSANAPPTYTYDTIDESVINTNWTDWGAFHGNSKSLNRKGAYTTIAPGENDARIFGYRHGTGRAKANRMMYRFNALFFDGHASTLADIDGADPAMWLPRGTVMSANPATTVGDGPYVTPDVVAKWKITSSWVSP